MANELVIYLLGAWCVGVITGFCLRSRGIKHIKEFLREKYPDFDERIKKSQEK